ncbi:MAG: 3-oxoacyl-ACP synthase [Lacinutrix sp.]|uniref:3-oxoacyl-ACP synthase n=1 Tax=Lacinutrix sp. TaxID=1937692 RepID=UPI003099BE54
MIRSNNTKQILYNKCVQFKKNRLDIINKTITELQESLTSETKSSAGDKHETGRAMVQLEREKAGNQLAEIQKLNQILSKIDADKVTANVVLGSLVFTTNANYFICISAGEFTISDKKYYAISANTPIAQLLLGKSKNDTFTFRNQNFTITAII